jgi:hypothetical protein
LEDWPIRWLNREPSREQGQEWSLRAGPEWIQQEAQRIELEMG